MDVYPSELADMLVDTGKEIREIEIKISKSDLWNGEKRKNKHKEYYQKESKDRPNKFYICVPEELLDEAKKWVEETNPKYGILIYRTDKYYSDNAIKSIKQAKSLHNLYGNWKSKFTKRLNNLAYKYYDLLIKED